MALQKCHLKVYTGLFQAALENTHFDETYAFLTNTFLEKKLY